MTDPFQETKWNLIQTWLWIYLQDSDFIKKHWGETHEDKNTTGLKVMAALYKTRKEGVYKIKKHMDGEEVLESYPFPEENFISKLKNGEIKAWGSKDESQEINEIPAEQWENLILLYEPPRASSRLNSLNKNKGWHNLRFRKADIIKYWPINPITKQARQTKKAVPQSKLDEMKKWYNGHQRNKNQSYKDDRKAIRGQFPEYSLDDSSIKDIRGPRKTGRPTTKKPPLKASN